MLPRFRYGLIFGLIGMGINTFLTAFLILCSPFTSLLMGGFASLYTLRHEQIKDRSVASRAGLISGLIAGALVGIGQITGTFFAWTLFRLAGIRTTYGAVPVPNPGANPLLFPLSSVLAAALCLGILGVIFAAGAGSLVGYTFTPEAPRRGYQ